MNEQYIQAVAGKLSLAPRQVAATALLLQEGATVPFIARYRKERTGQLDEVQITGVRDEMVRLVELDARRDTIVKSLDERKLLTDELRAAVAGAETLAALEDVYLPYRPKRRTRATIARERGLEPLATLLFAQDAACDPAAAGAPFVNAALGVESAEAALAGARDIVAEWVNEDAEIRRTLRKLFETEAVIESRVRKENEEQGAKYRDYFAWNEPVAKAPSHRLLAMFRGEHEEVLTLKIRPPEEVAVAHVLRAVVKNQQAAGRQVALAAEDAYKRLLAASMEVETRLALRERADEEAIKVFQANLRELLMAAPLGQRAVLALDPGFRTGCKLVCLDRQGKLLFHGVLHLTTGAREAQEAGRAIVKLCEQFKVEAIAIGNGTAGRETETVVRALPLPKSIPIVMVNESGASIYSASEAAREEFPDEDLTVRGAVSIGRRLMDPLAELVKLDPKSIGVGQYQHDVNQLKLKDALDDVVTSSVNRVGVELNTASKQLLTYASGLGPLLAANIVQYRNEHGPFASRAALKQVPRLGPKAFEQCAGFLRVRGGAHPLDASAVHPERYALVDRMAADLGCTVADLLHSGERRAQLDLSRYVSDDVGRPTLEDILQELARPGRDPREQFEAFAFDERVHKVEDLKPGMKLPGIVTNVTNFGAFVDVGVHQDGLVHISELSDQFVRNPADVVKVQQKVQVTVMEVDLARNRIALSLKSQPGGRAAGTPRPSAAGAPAPSKRPPAGGRPGFSSNPFAEAFGQR